MVAEFAATCEMKRSVSSLMGGWCWSWGAFTEVCWNIRSIAEDKYLEIQNFGHITHY